jgi:hypothetical protein
MTFTGFTAQVTKSCGSPPVDSHSSKSATGRVSSISNTSHTYPTAISSAFSSVDATAMISQQ